MSKLSKNQQIWLISHQYVCVLLENYRKHGFWFTSNKSWDLMKWNASGNVLISAEAITHFTNNVTLNKSSKASDFGGRRGARCFVAEHIYPTKQISTLVLKKFEEKNPTMEEFCNIFTAYNRICYVWHEEDFKLNSLGMKSSLPSDVDPTDLYSRYKSAGIDYIETNYKDGQALFKILEKLRKDNYNSAEISKLIAREELYE